METKRFILQFEITINVLELFLIHLNTYAIGLRPL